LLDLSPYLVKILLPNKETINGTGFFCHPEGYILTCYHVIEPHLNKNEVSIIYKDIRCQAKISKEYCLKKPDIAILKPTEGLASVSYLPLDVHERWSIDDRIYSFGYPKGYFQELGVSINGAIGGPTTIDSTNIIKITGLDLEEVNPGYSGAPILHLRTNKVIGLMNARYKPHQAFFVPLKELLKCWPEIKDFHDVFKKIKLELAKEAEEKLKEKLKETPFIPLSLEEGTIIEKPPGKKQLKEERVYGREWKVFDLSKLFPPAKSYILSSDAGTGKTTFFCWLTKELVNKTDTVPVFMTCAEFEEKNADNWRAVKEKLVGDYAQIFLKTDLEDFFDTYSKHQKIIFLFDGLDQISSGKYLDLTKRIFKIASFQKVVISSRPSAVVPMETEPNITFLRLKPFSLEAQKEYFGEHYEEASRLSALAPDLSCIPMLAYMVRMLIRENRAQGVLTRTDIYKRFVDHVIYHHDPNRPISTQEHQLTYDIKETLKCLSFRALALEEPQIQKISIALYNQCKTNPSLSVDDLSRFGLVNLILETGDITRPYLFFTHQSFQEFLAALYLHGQQSLIQSVINQMWHPKWIPVIKFLTGLMGEEIINRMYPGPEADCVIHAKLFLASECADELREISNGLRKKIVNNLKNLLRITPFETQAIYALGKIGDISEIKFLLGADRWFKRRAALITLYRLLHKVGKKVVKEAAEKLAKDPDWRVRTQAEEILQELEETVYKPASRFSTESRSWFMGEPVELSSKPVSKIKMEKAKTFEIEHLLEYLIKPWGIPEEIEKAIISSIQSHKYMAKIIIRCMEHENATIRWNVIRILGQIPKVDKTIVRRIALRLIHDEEWWVRWRAFQTLVALYKRGIKLPPAGAYFKISKKGSVSVLSP